MKFSVSLLAFSLGSITAATISMGSNNQHVLAPGKVKLPGDSPIYYCSESQKADTLHLKYIDLVPNPPPRGENFTVNAAGSLSAPIEDGAYIKVQIRYGFFLIYSSTVDLCEKSKAVDEPCTIEKGTRNISKVFDMPNDIPPGKYHVFADAYTVDDERITCLTAEISY